MRKVRSQDIALQRSPQDVLLEAVSINDKIHGSRIVILVLAKCYQVKLLLTPEFLLLHKACVEPIKTKFQNQ